MENIDIGTKIMMLRKKQNLSQAELGDIVGVSYKTVQRWEKQLSTPSVKQIVSLARLFGVPHEYLTSNTNSLEQNSTSQNVLGWTADSFFMKKGDIEIRIPLTEKTQPILDNFMQQILNSIVNYAQADPKHQDISNVDIKDNNIGRDAHINVGKVPAHSTN